ncbi:MAG: hypothetical protein JNL57_03690 [Bacteroidetes bacterium]|nr:hypothetical protein [Bacteroidota bacterium]
MRLEENNGANDPEVTKDYSLCANTLDERYVGVSSVLETSNNPILGQVSKLKVVEIDKGYNAQTKLRIEAQGYHLYSTCVKYADTAYYICGYMIEVGSTVPYPFLLKYNTSFTLQYAKKYTWNGIPLDMDFFTIGSDKRVVLVGTETNNVDWISGSRKSTIRIIYRNTGANAGYKTLSLSGLNPSASNYVDCINDIVMRDSAGVIYGYIIATASDTCTSTKNISRSYVVKLEFTISNVSIATGFVSWTIPQNIGLSENSFTGGAIEICGDNLLAAVNERESGAPVLACLNLYNGTYIYTVRFESPSPTTTNQGQINTHIPFVQSILRIDSTNVLITGKLIDVQFNTVPFDTMFSEMIWSARVEITATGLVFSNETLYLTEQSFPGNGPFNYTSYIGCNITTIYQPIYTAKNTVEDLESESEFVTLTFDANTPFVWPGSTECHKTWFVTNENASNCMYVDYSDFVLDEIEPPQEVVFPVLNLGSSSGNDISTIVENQFNLTELDCDNFPEP